MQTPGERRGGEKASLCFLNSPLDDDHKDRNTHRMMTRHLALHWLVIDTSWDVEQEVVDTHDDLFPLVIGLGQEGRGTEGRESCPNSIS